MYGNWGRLLKVDLTTGAVEDWVLEEEPYRDFLGGSGLAAYLFFLMKGYEAEPPVAGQPALHRQRPHLRHQPSGLFAAGDLRPLSPDRHLGGGEHGRPRVAGPEGHGIRRHRLHRRGGKAGLPLPGRRGRQLRDASHLWGEDTFWTEQALKEESGDARVEVMCIGPAGENLVKYASVVN